MIDQLSIALANLFSLSDARDRLSWGRGTPPLAGDSEEHDLTIFEANDYVDGHTNMMLVTRGCHSTTRSVIWWGNGRANDRTEP